MFNFIFRQIDPHALVLFRVVFGCLAFFDVLNIYIYYHWMKGAYDPQNFQFYYIGFEWVVPFKEPWMTLFFAGLMISSFGIILGYKYRWAAFIFALGFTYLFLIEKANYLNHGYLFCWIAWLMVLFPAQVKFSLDSKWHPNLARDYIDFWPLFLLRFLMGTVYFFGGIAKLNSDWLQGIPLLFWLPAEADAPIIGPLLKEPFMAYFMSYGGVVFDLCIPFLLLLKKTRTPAFLVALFFHGMNALIFNIGIFPYLSLALTALYFPPQLFASVFKSYKQKDAAEESNHFSKKKPEIVFLVSLLVVIHMTLPLRHHLFPGNVAWTEEGHRYSWRMMLRSKTGYGVFVVKNLNTEEKTKIDPGDYLTAKQERKLYTHPDMIWQFAQYLKSIHAEKGQEVAVYADIKVQLNNRKLKQFVDPGIDLANEKWHFYRSKKWIIPLTKMTS